MSDTKTTPSTWLKKIPPSLVELDEIPLMGHPPPFPWDTLQEQLVKSLNLPSLTIEPSNPQWRTEEELLQGLGDIASPLKIALSPFEGEAFWVMPEKDVKRLMTLMLSEGEETIQLLDEEYLQGFYQFVALEFIHALEQVEYDPEIKPKISMQAELPAISMLTLDISFSVQGAPLLCRLFITSELHKSLRAHYIQKGKEAPFQSPLAEKVELTVHLEAGNTEITQQEWAKVKPGDFLLIDHCTLKPEGDRGHIMLTVGGHPMFRGEIQDGKIKILEYPNYHEVK